MLKDRQVALGAVLGPILGAEGILQYGAGSDAEYSAATHSTALMDRSSLGRIELSGADRIEFLHRMSTNDIRTLQPGSGLQTVLTTPEAKILELLTVYARPESLLCITSPQNAAKVLGWFQRNIFFRDKVKPVDRSAQTIHFSLLGPRAVELLHKLGTRELDALPAFHSRTLALAGTEVLAARLPDPDGGFDLIAETASGEALWETVLDAGNEFGLRPLGFTAYNALRIEAGQPLYGLELSEDVNPLEAGLKSAISFAKGCYTGQEVIARLDTYQKLKQTLVRLELSRLPTDSLPLPLDSGGTEIGKLTSAARFPDGHVQGLGYVRMKAFQPGALANVLSAGQTIEATQRPLRQVEPVR